MAVTDTSLLAAAREGDQAAFDALIGPRRRELHAHCYRMLGSAHDADDALQESLLRAWRALPAFEGRSSLRSWLYRIATNVSLTQIEARPRRALPVDLGPAADADGGWADHLNEGIWLGPYDGVAPQEQAEAREDLELAFVAALQHLPPNERVALLMREVLGFSAQEVADAMATSVAAVNSALQRARKGLDDRLPDTTQRATLRTLGDERQQELVRRYTRALEEADVDGLLDLLTEDATWSMPPSPDWFRGRDGIRTFLLAGPLQHRWRHRPITVNGQLATACWIWDADRGEYVGWVVDVLDVEPDGRISNVTAFIDDRLFARLGLPATLPADTPATPTG